MEISTQLVRTASAFNTRPKQKGTNGPNNAVNNNIRGNGRAELTLRKKP